MVDHKKILVCGSADEAPVEMLIRSLKEMNAQFLILDQASLHEEVRLRWQITDNGLAGDISVGEESFSIHQIQSVYHRFVDPEDFFESDTAPDITKRSRSVLRSLMELFDVLDARIVNRRRPMMSNNSKPYQALLIKQAGFSIPETLITDDPSALAEFESSYGPLIYKSISSVRSIVSSFDKSSGSRLESLRTLTTQFQHKIEGFNVRVHVIGDQSFATQIISPTTDYRYAGQEGQEASFSPYELTDDLHNKCLNLSRICKLPFAGIDLIINPEKVYCLEINPSPGYSYYQDATGQPISDALAEYLMGE
ncbi:MAG: ATP-grasp domain-containing protein [Bacteroidota bacterium]